MVKRVKELAAPDKLIIAGSGCECECLFLNVFNYNYMILLNDYIEHVPHYLH